MPVYSERFADLVKALMKEKNVSLRAAQRMSRNKVTYGAVADWTQGNVPTQPDKIRHFADALKVPRIPLIEATGIYKPTDEDRAWDRDHFPELAQPPADDDPGEPIVELLREEMTKILKRVKGFGSLEWVRVPVVATASAGRARWTQPPQDPIEEREVPRVRIEGDCMAPVYKDGAELEIEYGTEVRARHEDCVVAVRAEDPVFKRLLIEKHGKTRVLVLHPINPEYDDEIIRSDDEHFFIAGVARRIVATKEYEEQVLHNQYLVQENKEVKRENKEVKQENARLKRELEKLRSKVGSEDSG